MPADVHELEERLTVLLAGQGDREAFRTLVDRYDRRLLYFVRRILGETDGALDILQSVWLTVHQGLWKLQATTAFRVWLYRIAHDRAVTELRRKTRRPLLFEEIDPCQHPDTAGDEEGAFDNAELV